MAIVKTAVYYVCLVDIILGWAFGSWAYIAVVAGLAGLVLVTISGQRR